MTWLVASDQFRQLFLLWRRHKVIRCTDEAQNKAETRLCSCLAPCKNYICMTQLTADFSAKGLLNLMTSSPVATGLAHKYSSFDFVKFSLGERCSVVYIIYPSCEIYMSWFVASDRLTQLSLLWRSHKVKASLLCTDEAQNKAEPRVCSYLVPCKNYIFKNRYLI